MSRATIEAPAVDVAEAEHPTTTVHFTAAVHIIDTKTSSTNDDKDNVKVDDDDSEEPLAGAY